MIIPKIEFRYSWIYDERYRNSPVIKVKLKKQALKYPGYKEISDYIKEIKPLWNKKEKKILLELSRISKLEWKESKIICYVIGYGLPISDPLTMKLYKNKNDFIDTLVHELIHQLFTQEGNLEKSKKAWDYIDKHYSSESNRTRIHVPLHAIHTHVYLKFFDKKRLGRDIEDMKNIPDYKKSWEIVQKGGHKNIINEFTRRIK